MLLRVYKEMTLSPSLVGGRNVVGGVYVGEIVDFRDFVSMRKSAIKRYREFRVLQMCLMHPRTPLPSDRLGWRCARAAWQSSGLRHYRPLPRSRSCNNDNDQMTTVNGKNIHASSPREEIAAVLVPVCDSNLHLSHVLKADAYGDVTCSTLFCVCATTESQASTAHTPSCAIIT